MKVKKELPYYHDIYHCPMLVWDLINKTENLDLLLKDENIPFPKRIDKRIVWQRIYRQYIDVFGLSKLQEQWFELKKQEADFIVKSHEKNGKHNINFARLKELEAKELLNSIEVSELTKINSILVKHYGFHISPATTSIYDYVGLINGMNNK